MRIGQRCDPPGGPHDNRSLKAVQHLPPADQPRMNACRSLVSWLMAALKSSAVIRWLALDSVLPNTLRTTLATVWLLLASMNSASMNSSVSGSRCPVAADTPPTTAATGITSYHFMPWLAALTPVIAARRISGLDPGEAELALVTTRYF